MSDFTSPSDKEPGTSNKCKGITNNFYGPISTRQLHAGVGNNNADAGNILLDYA